MKYFELNNGVKIPAIGLGTNTIGKENGSYWADLNGDYRPIMSAVKLGYRMFDNARGYRNEGGIGNALYESGVPRSELFIISKIPGIPECVGNEESIRAALEDSLRLLRTDYVDLYMIHHPWSDSEGMVAAYKVIEKLREEGMVKTIGVSNFTPDLLELILTRCNEAPQVNEYQINVFDWHDETTKYCKEHNILPIAWGPLLGIPNFMAKDRWSFTPDQLKMLLQRSQGKASIPELNRYSGYSALISEMAEKYGRTWAQIQLNLNYHEGIVSIPKSFDSAHQKDNLESLDFEMSDADYGLLYDAARGIGETKGVLKTITHKDAKMAGDI